MSYALNSSIEILGCLLVSIFDLAGKKLIELVVQPASDRVQIDLSSLEEGMYLIKFHNDQILNVHPFIISR